MTDWQPIKTTTKEQVLSAMELLLTAKQINYVKSQTSAGPSKIAVIRRLINIGIQVEAADGSERFRDYVLKNIWPQVRDMLQAVNEAKNKEIAILRAEKHLAALKEGE